MLRVAAVVANLSVGDSDAFVRDVCAVVVAADVAARLD